MPRHPKPWFRKSRGLWYVEIDGKQFNLGADRHEAFCRYHQLMNQPKRHTVVEAESVLAVFDAFLDWTHKHRAEATYVWYKERLERFARALPDGISVGQLKPLHVQRWLDDHPQFVYPQFRQVKHPGLRPRGQPQFGQRLPLQTSSVSGESPKVSSSALAIASGQERTVALSPLFLAVAAERQRMPRNCSASSFGSTPDRRATDVARHVASDCDGQPPALPRLANTSHNPASSRLTVTNKVPQPMRNFEVLPVVTRRRGRGRLPDTGTRDPSPAAENVCSARAPSR